MDNKTLYRWHRRLGLSLGVVLFFLAVSGLAITYRDELLPMTYSALRVEPMGERAPLEGQLLAAKAALPGETLTHLYTSERDDTANMVFYRPKGAWLPHLLAVNPYTGQVQGGMPLLQNVFGVMLYLHANLFLGKVGAWIVGLMGLLLTGFFVSGLLLWWPKNGAWAAKWRGLKQGNGRGVHRFTGVFLGPLLLFSALTGFVLAFDLGQPVGRMLGAPARPEELSKVQECSFEQQLAVLNILTPAQRKNLVSLHLCTPKNGFMKLSYGLHERSGHDGFARLVVDPRTGKVLQRFDSSTDPKSWNANALIIYPLHTGEALGLFGKFLNILNGAALALLFLTGLWPTLKRYRISKHSQKTVNQPHKEFS